jgi:hypothetical protein
MTVLGKFNVTEEQGSVYYLYPEGIRQVKVVKAVSVVSYILEPTRAGYLILMKLSTGSIIWQKFRVVKGLWVGEYVMDDGFFVGLAHKVSTAFYDVKRKAYYIAVPPST